MTCLIPMKTGQVPIAFVKDMLGKLIASDCDWKNILKQSAIDPASLNDLSAYVSLQSYTEAQKLAMETMRDEMLGYGHQVQRIGIWRNACRAVMHEGSLSQALERLIEFINLFDFGLRLSLVINADEVRLEVQPSAGVGYQHPLGYELLLSRIYLFLNWLIRKTIPLKGVYFCHQENRSRADYWWLFRNSPVTFSEPNAALRFEKKWLDFPVQYEARSLESWLNQGYPNSNTIHFHATSWAERVRDLLTSNLPQVLEFHDVAAHLLVAPKTLRRWLAEEGVAYQDIKDEVRRAAADYYLSKGGLSLVEIAYRSGFSEASCFIRAFKRWTGITPHIYSLQQRTAQPSINAANSKLVQALPP